MNPYSVSCIFPDNFLWGCVSEENFFQDKENYAYIFKLKEHHINAILLSIPWSKCVPLKGNFDEVFIESIRSLLSKIRGQNIEPILILDTNDIPVWQNLDHPDKRDYEDENNFLVHLSDVLIPYANYFTLICPENNLFSRGRFSTKLTIVNNVIKHIHSLSETAKAGLRISSSIEKSGKWFLHPQYEFLKRVDCDYLGIPADKSSMQSVQNVFGTERKPILFLTDDLNTIQEEDRIGLLADKLFDTWQFYQKGWPIIGFFSETELNNNSPEYKLYINSCQKNAFEISTQMNYLPDKWIQFLKD